MYRRCFYWPFPIQQFFFQCSYFGSPRSKMTNTAQYGSNSCQWEISASSIIETRIGWKKTLWKKQSFKLCFKSHELFQYFFQRFIPIYTPLKPFFKRKLPDRKWVELVILPTAKLRFFCYGLRSVWSTGTDSGLKKWLNRLFVFFLWTN